MERNRRTYFYVRFQLGIHHHADYGNATKKQEVLERFLKAADYSFRHQLDSDGFDLQIPEALHGQGTLSRGDLSSGTAFFASSLGEGLYAMQTNDWVQSTT